MKYLLLISLLSVIGLPAEAKQIHKERSIYRNVVITEEDNLRCMRFETRRQKVTNQACIDLINKDRVVFEYAHGLLAGYAINPNPKKILIIGLGGGVLSNVMHQISPDAEITNVDIDPVVFKLAKQYFDYQEPAQVKTVIKDGRVFVKRALLNNEEYDWIILDAFNGDYIPEHLMTQEFLSETKALLSDSGILTANTFSGSLLFDYESVTYQKVFGNLQIFQSPTKGNRVIFAAKGDLMKSFPVANELVRKYFAQFAIDPVSVWKNISNRINWNEDSPVLTDQYSPANLLRQAD